MRVDRPLAGSDDFDAWPATKIELYATRTEFQGKRVPCVRIAAPRPAASRVVNGRRSRRGILTMGGYLHIPPTRDSMIEAARTVDPA